MLHSREIKLELSTASRKYEDGKYYVIILHQVAVQGWMEWWRGKVLPHRAFWPGCRGKHLSISEDQYSCSGLCIWTSPVCPVSVLPRACAKLIVGRGRAYEKRVGKRIPRFWLSWGDGFVTTCDTSLQNGAWTCFLGLISALWGTEIKGAEEESLFCCWDTEVVTHDSQEGLARGCYFSSFMCGFSFPAAGA